MIISNHNKETIRIQSQYLERLLQSASPDISICLTGKIACSDDEPFSQCIDIVNFWSANLDAQVVSKMTIKEFVFRNTITDKYFTIPIDVELSKSTSLIELSKYAVTINPGTGKVNTPVSVLAKGPWTITDGYTENIEEDGLEGYTLEDLDSVLELIRLKINNFFLSIGITSTVTVEAEGNSIKISNFPQDVLPSYITFDDEVTNTYFTYGLEDDVYMLDKDLYIKPSFFDLTTLEDGVYSFELIGYDGTEYFKEENCLFVDINTAARVATTLKNLLQETKELTLVDKESSSTYISMLHYSLTVGSNEKCNCVDLCNAFTELICLLDSVDKTKKYPLKNGCKC